MHFGETWWSLSKRLGQSDRQRVKDSNVELGKTKINKKGAIESLNSDMKDLLEWKNIDF